MPWETDPAGRVLRDATLVGRWYRPTEPTGEASDHVQVVGVEMTGHREALEPVLLVTCAEFGAIPDGWGAPVERFDPDEFYAAHTEMSDAELATIALEQAALSKAADKAHREAQIERLARWNAPVERRTAHLKKSGGDLS